MFTEQISELYRRYQIILTREKILTGNSRVEKMQIYSKHRKYAQTYKLVMHVILTTNLILIKQKKIKGIMSLTPLQKFFSL